MAVVSELLRCESDGTISFGDFTLAAKAKLDNVEHQGDVYKVKTFREITKLERNGGFVYESVPGTAVEHLDFQEDGMHFLVSGGDDAQITLGLEPETEYKIVINHVDSGVMKTNLGGKLNISVELDEDGSADVAISKA